MPLLRFDAFSLDTESRLLRRDGVAIPLPPKELACLELLLSRRPRAVSKGEIQDVLWPRTVVTESNLTSLVTNLRSALGDDAKAPRFIRTVYGFGYAFSGAVESGAEGAPALAGAGPHLLFEGRRYPLKAGENVLGRVDGATVWLESKTASRRHARIVVGASGATIEDLGSKNGTFVGGERVTTPRALASGDEIEIGRERIRFVEAASAGSTRTDIR